MMKMSIGQWLLCYLGALSVSSTLSWIATTTTRPRTQPTAHDGTTLIRLAAVASNNNEDEEESASSLRQSYDLGIGKNKPYGEDTDDNVEEEPTERADNWQVPNPVQKPPETTVVLTPNVGRPTTNRNNNNHNNINTELTRTRRMVARDQESQQLRMALWDEQHFNEAQEGQLQELAWADDTDNPPLMNQQASAPPRPAAFYPDIDLSVPASVYTENKVDIVWDLLRWEAYEQAQREPLLVSFLHSTILNHPSLESSLAFLLANRLQSPGMMISTQLQSVILQALQSCPVFRRSLRADIMAVRDRDPACHYLPDVFLYFKGFHALQSHRVANCLWRADKRVLATFLQSQVSQTFQIDIHPNATLGSGILVDHGTGVVIGSTATVGHNCSVLHHVTLGGSGKKGVDRHPIVEDGVLLGAGATVLGRVRIGQGCQIGAGTLVISDLPAHSVAVGVPARIIGSFVDVTSQPSTVMNQLLTDVTFESDGI